jgi:transformation/transcription domain-associated protein
MTRHVQQTGNISPTRADGITPTAEGNISSVEPPLPPSVRQPYEYIEEIVSILKTAFPLLALTMETFVDQIHTRFKATPDEDTYRFTSILVAEAMTVRAVSTMVCCSLT